MTVIVNGEPHEVTGEATVASLLRDLKLPPQRVAVEVNFELVPRALHDRFALHPGDRLEVVTLVGGG